MEDEQETTISSVPSSEPDVLEGWTKQEKYGLLLGLKLYGSYESDALCVTIHTKTPAQIQKAIAYYKRKALKHPIINERKRKDKSDVKSYPRIPLASWAKCLTDSLSYEELQTETAAALRLIAEFENIPLAACTDNVDFRKAYHFIANAMEGKSLPNDQTMAALLDKCIVETALMSKSFIRNSAFKYAVENIDMKNKEINIFPIPTLNNELGNIGHIASQKNYNPMNISEVYLKPSDL